MSYQVYKIFSDFYYVKNSDDVEFVCKLKETLKKQEIEIKVGDYVELSNDNNFISNLLKRKNSLDRPKISNIDYMLVMCALVEPELDLIQLNRYLTYLKYNKIPCAVCFNKIDAIQNIDEKIKKINDTYNKLGYKTFFISAKNKINLDSLINFIKNKTVALCGLSGVGKSTLLNALFLNTIAKTNKVSTKTQRGCHTTRHSEIFETNEFKIADTPGFSCIKFDFLLPEELINLFDDLKQYSGNCKYSNCLHNVNENNICSVYDNLDKIDKTRYESYLCFLKEAVDYKTLISKRSIKNESRTKITGNRKTLKISKAKRTSSRSTIKQKLRIRNYNGTVQKYH